MGIQHHVTSSVMKTLHPYSMSLRGHSKKAVAISSQLSAFYLLLRSPRFARDDSFSFDKLSMVGEKI